VVGSKVALFSMYSFMIGLIISGSLRLVSLIKLSEEAGIQFFGDDDNVGLKRVRIISFTVAGNSPTRDSLLKGEDQYN
jgi:hypothetical protein